MKMAKKLLALVLTGVMAMSVLTGCGSTASRQAAGKLEGKTGIIGDVTVKRCVYAEGSKPQCYR